MDNSDWLRVEKSLKLMNVPVLLKCDEYMVQLVLMQRSVYKNAIFVFVNDNFKGHWLLEDCEERRRFFPKIEKYKYKAKDRKNLKKMSRKSLKSCGLADVDPDGKYEYYHYCWTDFRKLKKHLIANNKIIVLYNDSAFLIDPYKILERLEDED